MTEKFNSLSQVIQLGKEALLNTEIIKAEEYLLQVALNYIRAGSETRLWPELRNAQGRFYLYIENHREAENYFKSALVQATELNQPDEQLNAWVGLMSTYRTWHISAQTKEENRVKDANYCVTQASKLVESSDEWSLAKVDFFLEKALLQKEDKQNTAAYNSIDHVLSGCESLKNTIPEDPQLRVRLAYAYAIKASVFDKLDDNSGELIGYINKSWDILRVEGDTKTTVEAALIFGDYYLRINPENALAYYDAAINLLEAQPVSDDVNGRYLSLLLEKKAIATFNLQAIAKPIESL